MIAVAVISVSLASWLAIRQGYPTAECFQIGQKCLKCFSPGFRSMFGYFGIALKIFICSDVLGELWLSRESLVAFSSHLNV